MRPWGDNQKGLVPPAAALADSEVASQPWLSVPSNITTRGENYLSVTQPDIAHSCNAIMTLMSGFGVRI